MSSRVRFLRSTALLPRKFPCNRFEITDASESQPLKISVITAVYNRKDTLADALRSVQSQTHDSIEHIVVDGMSHDGTDKVVDQYRDHLATVLREPDRGIYDALNKGIGLATGDVVGFLHADDVLAGVDCLASIAGAFSDDSVDAVFADLLYVDGNMAQIVRYWKDTPYDRRRFRFGWMPAHPTVYVRREHYEKFGGFRDDLRSAADYESLVRLFYKHKLNAVHVPKVLVKMRVGGQSNASIANRRLANREDHQAWLVNDLSPPWFLRVTKPLRKVSQYWRRPTNE